MALSDWTVGTDAPVEAAAVAGRIRCRGCGIELDVNERGPQSEWFTLDGIHAVGVKIYWDQGELYNPDLNGYSIVSQIVLHQCGARDLQP